jgi:hypothetical protein
MRKDVKEIFLTLSPCVLGKDEVSKSIFLNENVHWVECILWYKSLNPFPKQTNNILYYFSQIKTMP